MPELRIRVEKVLNPDQTHEDKPNPAPPPSKKKEEKNLDPDRTQKNKMADVCNIRI